MNDRIDEKALQAINELIVTHTGIFFDENHTCDLERHIYQTCKDLKIPVESCLNLIENSTSVNVLLDALVKNITIGETYFFRDKNLFLYLRDTLLPDLIRERRNSKKLFIRLWSAACSSGEEPYSLAILLRYLIPDLSEWDIYIIATDINQEMLTRAQKGIYSRWSFRDDPIVPIGQYFTPTADNKLMIDGVIKDMVLFERMNLINDTFFFHNIGPSSLDIVLCRNVLMYFSHARAYEVVTRLIGSLRKNGILIVSPQEIGIISHTSVSPFHQGSIYLHIKGGLYQNRVSELSSGTEHSVLTPYPMDTVSDETVLTLPDISPECQVFTEPEMVSISSLEEMRGENLFETLIAENKLDDAADILSRTALSSGYLSLSKQIEMMIKAYAGLGEYEKALVWSERMIAVEPLNPRPYQLRAAVLDEKGFIDLAIQSLRQSLYADPDYLPAHLAIAGGYMKSGKPELAKHHYSLAISLLESLPADQILEETEGIPADKMKDMIQILLGG